MKPKTNRIKNFLEAGITEVHKVKGYKRACRLETRLMMENAYATDVWTADLKYYYVTGEKQD